MSNTLHTSHGFLPVAGAYTACTSEAHAREIVAALGGAAEYATCETAPGYRHTVRDSRGRVVWSGYSVGLPGYPGGTAAHEV